MCERDYCMWDLKDKLWTVQTCLGACVSSVQVSQVDDDETVV